MKKRISFLLAAVLTLAVMLPAFFALPVLADEGDTFNASSSDAVLYISTPNDYINFFKAAFVNEPKNDFSGKTIVMTKDIDLNDVTTEGWYAKEGVTKLSGTNTNWVWFKGTFDGGNHTLKGVIVEGSYRSDAPIGIFPYAINATIKNLVVDGFYVCSPNTTVGADNGNGGIGGLIGHAKENITIDNVTMRNGIVTCVENGKGAMGAIIGNYDQSANVQAVNITNCTVENTVELLAGENAAISYMGGIVGMTDSSGNWNKHYIANIDLTGSCIQPKGSMGDSATLKPWGYGHNGHGNYQHVFNIKNEATGYTTNGNKWLGTNVVYTDALNEFVLASGCYGATAAPIVRLVGTQTRAEDNAVRFVGMLKIPELLTDVTELGFEITVGDATVKTEVSVVFTSIMVKDALEAAPDGYYYFTYALTAVPENTEFTYRAYATVGDKVCTTTAGTYTYTLTATAD